MAPTETAFAHKAFSMFRDWVGSAQFYHPELDFTIKDEQLIVEDVKNSFTSARRSLLKEEKKEDRMVPGYDYGFMSGFVRSSLDGQWFNEYIRKQSSGYKEFLAIKALKSYLEFDTITAARIVPLYTHLLNENSNLATVNEVIPANNLDKIGGDMPEENSSNIIVTVLINQINRYIIETFHQRTPEYMLSLHHYFTAIEVESYITNSQLS
jgi:hypothetical protein